MGFKLVNFESVRKRGLVLMYHRVAELAYDPWRLAVSPSHFEGHLQVIKKYGRPVQMREMGRNLKYFSFGRKEIVLSFDDGYVDNSTIARPILEMHGVPATFFVVSGAVDSKREFWWDELERITDLSQEGREKTYFENWQVLSALSTQGKRDALDKMTRSGNKDNTRAEYLPMTTKELMTLAKCSLFEIGAHTVSHPMLSRLALEEQKEEVLRSKEDLEGKIGQAVTSFSYPHGDYSDDTLKFVRQSGFKNACTVIQEPVMRGIDPFLLPRFTVLNWNADEFERNLRQWI